MRSWCLMVFYLSYFFLALPAASLLKLTGMKKGLALSLLVMAVGAAMFGQLATQRWYPGALAGLFVIGGGLALLQTAVNPYISILGPIESAARRIALMGICNKVAGILAPLLIGTVVLHGIGDLSEQVAGSGRGGEDAAAERFRGQDPRAVPGDGGRAGAAGRRDPVFLAARAEDFRSQCRTRRRGCGRQAQHLPVPAPVAGRAVPVRVRGRGGAGGRCDRHLRQWLRPAAGPDQVLHFVHSRRDVAGLSGGAGGDPALHLAGALSERVRGAGRAVRDRRVPDPWLRVGRLRRGIGLRQRDDVAGDLPAGDQGPGPLHRDRFRVADHGHRRRRDHSAPVRGAEAALRLPAGVRRGGGALLPVHPVLRIARPPRRA